LPPIDAAEIERRFTHHVPLDQQVRGTHDAVREQFKSFALQLADQLPESREKSLAFTELESASFWAHAAVAREGK
jgi:hypothetical protein